ncbi:MAG TPA: isoprenylcysteine carboxylmethyltransferase family protein [Nitrospiraceae bacterium]|nr:isoprenylcysteine carboxylmethyltransferase family protein [Nitrospiraceae bacterium]
MQALELKVPPLVVGMIVGGLMWLTKRAVPVLGFTFPGRRPFAIILAIAGAAIIVMGFASFRRAKTTVNPMKPDSASSLVVSGIYDLTRNPMYLGFLVILVGWAFFLSNALGFIFLPLFVLYMNRFQIEPEERALASLFGEAFASYRSRVRRWL